MLPDPKTNPPTRGARIVWGLLIAVIDGVLRLFEIRYSMFYALFGLCATLPVLRWIAQARGIQETDPWRTAVLVLRGGSGATPVTTPAPVAATRAAEAAPVRGDSQ